MRILYSTANNNTGGVHIVSYKFRHTTKHTLYIGDDMSKTLSSILVKCRKPSSHQDPSMRTSYRLQHKTYNQTYTVHSQTDEKCDCLYACIFLYMML